jgi:hypothetical protein
MDEYKIDQNSLFNKYSLIDWAIGENKNDLHMIKCLVENLHCYPQTIFYKNRNDVSEEIHLYLLKKKAELKGKTFDIMEFKRRKQQELNDKKTPQKKEECCIL